MASFFMFTTMITTTRGMTFFPALRVRPSTGGTLDPPSLRINLVIYFIKINAAFCYVKETSPEEQLNAVRLIFTQVTGPEEIFRQ